MKKIALKIKRIIKFLLLKINKTEGRTAKIEPASSGKSMYEFIDLILNWTTLAPKNVFEIGANLGQDSVYLMSGFKLKSNDIYIFEPHPILYKNIQKNLKFNCFNYAISNKNSKVDFNAVNLSKEKNTGISSLRKHGLVDKNNFDIIKVDSWRMDKFMTKYKVKVIDFIKIDVEGCNYEVLEGFGSKIKYVNSIHIESEHVEIWKRQKLWINIKKYLEKNDFEMIYFKRYKNQSDSLWIRKMYIK